MRPSRLETIFAYFSSYVTRLLASTAPSGKRPLKLPGLTVSSGKNVARPARSSRKKAMAALAAVSFSTTMFCKAKPSAVSMATSYPGLTERMVDTGPVTPRRRRFAAAFITALTLLWKPSILRSRSFSMAMRCRAASMARRSFCSFSSACASAPRRLSTLSVRPPLMFSSRVSRSTASCRKASVSAFCSSRSRVRAALAAPSLSAAARRFFAASTDDAAPAAATFKSVMRAAMAFSRPVTTPRRSPEAALLFCSSSSRASSSPVRAAYAAACRSQAAMPSPWPRTSAAMASRPRPLCPISSFSDAMVASLWAMSFSSTAMRESAPAISSVMARISALQRSASVIRCSISARVLSVSASMASISRPARA